MAEKEREDSPIEECEEEKFINANVGEIIGNTAMKNVSDWVRRSVLFWNKQDTVSIDESSDTQENDCGIDRVGLEDNSTKSSAKSDIQVLVDREEFKLCHNPESESLFLDVEKIQRLCIDPFIMESNECQEVLGDLSNETPYYTLNFPKYSRHMYSPLYEEYSNISNKALENSQTDENGWNIADTLNKLSQTWGQVDSNANKNIKDQQDTGESDNKDDKNTEEMESKQRYLNNDVLSSIKKVQETLGEIAAELENKRNRNISRDRDPNVILINLLSRIEPPVNRDSFGGSLADETTPFASQDTADFQNSIKRNSEISIGKENMATESHQNEDQLAEFDVIKELSDPAKSTEAVLEQFMQKLSTAEKPSSTIRGLLRRISEEISGENDEKLGKENETEGLSDRRTSTTSGHSSMPTTPNTTNYDSGFSEQHKTITNGTKATPFAVLLKETIELDKEVIECTEKKENDFDSETSTDCSPYSTLSMNENTSRISKGAYKSMSVRRGNNRRRSTGGVGPRPSSKLMSTGSCPSFDGNRVSPLPGSVMKYTKSEVEAIRKFLSLTSLYFGTRMPGKTDDFQNEIYDELMEKEDIEKIHEILMKQREDLEKQRRQQDDLFGRLGDMLLQLVTLKEEHLSSTSKQTKALTLLKKQLDMQKKEQLKAQDTIKDQMKTLEERFTSEMDSLQRKSDAETIPNLLSLDTTRISDSSTGHIIWKLTGITRKLTRMHAGTCEGVSVSEPFYSGPYGYKMAVWLYLRGRGDYKGKGMSVYVCPLSGEYDAILPWPIRPVYTFTLIDQNPDSTRKRDHTKVRRIPETSKRGDTLLSSKGGLPRPQSGSKSFIVGFDDFISQNELAQGSYIVDDTLFLKVEAEIPQ